MREISHPQPLTRQQPYLSPPSQRRGTKERGVFQPMREDIREH